MTQHHILVVDDEPLNLEIIGEFLDDPSYVLDMVERAEIAWEHLESQAVSYDLLLLDRMMPGMSGMDLLNKIKADERFASIPVIMQTAAGSQQQIREGIEAGAYYYLTKPYAPETLVAIVRSALLHAGARKFDRPAHLQAMEMLDRAEFRFRTREQIRPLVEVLSALCPDPARVAPGLAELLINAVEHGNLGFNYDDKKSLRLQNAWEDAVARRAQEAGYSGRSVGVFLARHPDRIEFVVEDQGDGFAWERYLDFDPQRVTDPNGRGVAMARKMSFSSLEYQGRGNRVTATVDLPR